MQVESTAPCPTCGTPRAVCPVCSRTFAAGPRKLTETCSPTCRTARRVMPMAERIWPKVARDDSPDGCWLWLGKIGRNGYGQFATTAGRFRAAHRAVWELANGRALTDAEVVCHRCDNPPCVRPGHLFIGTQGDNMRDMRRKMRHSHGEDRPSSKLTAEQVREIRRAYWAGEGTQGGIARQYGVRPGTIWGIVHRLDWKHVD